MIFLIVLSVLTIQARSFPGPEGNSTRSGKFMRFGNADDLFSDLLDEMQDPLSSAEAITSEGSTTDSTQQTDPYRVASVNDTDGDREPIKTDEKIALYNQNTGKFELITSTSGHFMLPMKPVTENGVIFYGGQHYHYRKPVSQDPNSGNRTGEIKIFWSSVTDAIESLPFLPLQVNVPDMISAMANFLTTSIPVINRFTNPNHPRLPANDPKETELDNNTAPLRYGSFAIRDNTVEDRELKNDEISSERKPSKIRKSHRRKSSKRKNAKNVPKGIVQRPIFRRTTELPAQDTKVWHHFGAGDPNVLKNMPITRKRYNVRDREVFNFKNSDISNSPIMILNIPNRPMVYYKTSVDQNVGEKKTDGLDKKIINKINENLLASPKGKVKGESRINSKKTTPKRVRNVPKTRGTTTEKTAGETNNRTIQKSRKRASGSGRE